MKNYIGFINDHSGSMQPLVNAAIADYNTNIIAVKDAATAEMLDTVVSVVGVGFPRGNQVTRQIVISNPHVLKPIDKWVIDGGTPLYDGIGNMIQLFESLPDYNNENVSFLIMITTDGEENASQFWKASSIKEKIIKLQNTGRWTFVFRVPKYATNVVANLGVPRENIQPWETTAKGMAESTTKTVAAMGNFFRARTAGARSSSSFYADASQVNLAVLTDISKKVSLYVIEPKDNGIQIRDFILKHRQEYLKGSAFYQLTKTEARVQPSKKILIRERTTGKIFAGDEARQMIGLNTINNARLHPGDHKNYDIFIQSESINRKLVGGTGVLYWKEIGVPFTSDDLKHLLVPAQPKDKNEVVQLPLVPVTNKPTPSPIPVTPRTQYFETREDARRHCTLVGKAQAEIKDFGKISPKGKRWAV